MKEFIGLVMYPFLFSTSCLLVSADRSTHSFMLRTGIEVMCLVRMLSPWVSFGVFGLSAFPLAFFVGLDLGFDFDFGLLSAWGGLGGAIARPLRVLLSASSNSAAERGVGGEPAIIVWLY
jgi:hypothetical protein